MLLDSTAALWFAIATLPLTLYVCWTDMARMLIYNKTVLALIVVFLILSPFLLPWQVIGWQLLNAVITLVIVFLLTSFGVLGAGDSKFIAAAALYIVPGDWMSVAILFAVTTFVAIVLHRVGGKLGLQALTPTWESWSRKKDFPLGLALGPTLSIYLFWAAFG